MKEIQLPEHLKSEAEAFDNRLNERDEAGFVADFRNAVKCDYFYKSFFRDPYYIRLYYGKQIEWFLSGLEKIGKGLTILDVGCGPGILSLELARAGHHVTGLDISEKSIAVAKKALANNKYSAGFGSLKYEVKPFDEIEGKYDAIVYCGALHHFQDVGEVVKTTSKHLKNGGGILCHEPCHEQFRKQDAAQVALIRTILSITGHWYEEDLSLASSDKLTEFDKFVDDVYIEYITERDKNETGGQSPNDLSSTGDEIIHFLNQQFHQVELISGFSFIYRLLGGMRGDDVMLYKLADLFSTYDSFSVSNNYMKPNGFFYFGKLKE
jgi:2-polyprenyl-3-methyl-5-hydroxy-6-metoxy-1,4-benzoquinol methylase